MTSNKPRDDLSICYLNECFTADFEEGTLTWKVRPSNHFKNETVQKRWNSRYSGTLAGNVYTRKSGYQSFQVGIMDTSYLVHRILWALHITRREGIIRPYLTQSKDFFEAVCARKSFELKNGFDKNHGIALDN